MKILVRPKAKADIYEQAVYLSQDSVPVANRFLKEIKKTFSELTEMPQIGAPCRLKLKKLGRVRVWPVNRFPKILIFHQNTGRSIEIIRVLHSARDLKNLL